MENIFLLLISTALVNNIVVGHVIGGDPALTSIQKNEIAYGLSRIMLILLPIITFIATAVSQFILIPLQLQYLQTFVFVLLIIMLAYGLKAWPNSFCKKYDTDLLLPLAGINATALGTLLLYQQQGHHLFYSFIFGLGTAIGFGLILVLFTAIQTRLEMADVPTPFKGSSITLITLGLLSMAFLGFQGL